MKIAFFSFTLLASVYEIALASREIGRDEALELIYVNVKKEQAAFQKAQEKEAKKKNCCPPAVKEGKQEEEEESVVIE